MTTVFQVGFISALRRKSRQPGIRTLQKFFLHKAGMEKHERLKTARIAAGYASASDAAKRLAMPYGTYSGHENGMRGMRDEDLRMYARVFKVPLAWLAFGEDIDQGRSEVAIKGMILSGGYIETDLSKYYDPFKKDSFGEAMLSFVVPNGICGYQVDSTNMKPVYSGNDLLLVKEIQTFSTDAYMQHQSILSVIDRGMFLGELYPGSSRERYHVVTPTGNVLQNVYVDWVGEIFAIVKAFQIRQQINRYIDERKAVKSRQESTDR